jgi:hypothetical protein
MKRLVILAEGPRPTGTRRAVSRSRDGATGKMISAVLKHIGVAYWHYIGNVWLVRDPRDRSKSWWRETLQTQVGKGGRIVVMDVEVNSWSGLGPSGMLDWLRKGWRTRSGEGLNEPTPPDDEGTPPDDEDEDESEPG